MIKKILLIVAVVLAWNLQLQSQIRFTEINGSQDWELLKTQAKSEGKLIFLDIYATWCGPCKYLEANVYTDKVLGDIYNKYYLSAKIDGETEFGSKLATAYELEAYPSMYFLSPDETMLSTIVGVKEAVPLGEIGKVVSEQRDKLAQWSAITDFSQFKKQELIDMHKLFSSAGLESKASVIGGHIVPYLSEAEIFAPEYKSMVLSAPAGMDDKVFKALAGNREKAISWFGQEAFDEYLSEVFQVSLTEAIEAEDKAKVDAIVTEFLPVYIGENPEERETARFITWKLYYANTLDWAEYKKLVENRYNEKFKSQDSFLYDEAYALASDYNYDPDALGLSASLAEQALSLNSSFDNLVLMAYVQAMLGDKDKAGIYLDKISKHELSEDQQSMFEELKELIESME